jgi:hypothetical protein
MLRQSAAKPFGSPHRTLDRRIIRVLKEFKAFIMSGNLVEIAVGLVVAEEVRTLRALLVGRLREGDRMGPS